MVGNFLLAVLVVLLSSCFKSGTTSNYGGPSAYKSGDIMLQGLLPLTYRDNGKCERLDVEDGLIWMVAMMYAVEEINKSGLLLRATLGYKIDNTCVNIPTAMNQAIRIVSKHRPNSVCRPEENVCRRGERMAGEKISAVIGPAISWIAIPVASLLSLYSIPLISYASTSRILSDKSRYKSFLRTIPSDDFQAQAMADFVQYFHWNYVYLIASDDDYGKMGAAAFKAEARKLGVCVPSDEYINFTAENSKELIYSALKNVKKATRAKVLVIFSYLEQGKRLLEEAQEQNITDRTWITSDAWGTKAAKLNVSRQLLNGIFTFASASRKIPKFDSYIRNLTVEKIRGNIWLEKYFGKELGCEILSRTGNGEASTSKSRRLCSPLETLHRGDQFSSTTSENAGNVIDAVFAVTHGFRDIFICKGLNNASYCPGVRFSVEPEKLLMSIKNTTFKSVSGTPMEFNKNGEKTFSEYTIRNLQETASGSMRYTEIGKWIRSGDKTDFIINKTLIAWSSGKRPESRCFRECQPGERVVGQSECCWNCQRCEKGSVSSVKGANTCTSCNDTYYANEARTRCLLREIVYLRYSDPAGVSIITISCLGLILTTTIVAIIIRSRSTPIVHDFSPVLLGVFFVTLYISFFFSIGHAINIPSDNSCAALNSLFEFLQMLYSVFLLTKTRQANRWLRSAVSSIRADAPIVYAQLVTVCVLLLVQGILIALWQSMNTSQAHYVNVFDDARLLECKEDYPILRVLVTVFPIIVLVAATLIAFRERNLPDNFNEAKFISFATIALCIIVIAFFPTYRYVGGITKVLVVTFTSFIAAFSCMGCVFIPKLYIIVFRAERNVSVPSQKSNEICVESSWAVPSSGNHNQQHQRENFIEGNACALDQNSQNTHAKAVDTPLHANGKARSRSNLSNLQERFNLEPLHESESSEDAGELQTAVDGACVADMYEQETEVERSSVHKIGGGELEVVPKHYIDTDISRNEYLV